MGTEAGTNHVDPIALTKENADIVQRLLVSDGLRVIERIVQISSKSRAPKNDTALFALALAAAAIPGPAKVAREFLILENERKKKNDDA